MWKTLGWLSSTLTKRVSPSCLCGTNSYRFPYSTQRSRTSKVSGKANLSTSSKELGQHQIKSKRSHLERSQWKARRQGQSMLPSAQSQRPSSDVPNPQTPSTTQTDEWETKATLRLSKVILEQDKETRTQQLCCFLHWVKSKPVIRSGKVRKLMSDKENQAKDKHAPIWEPCQKTGLSPVFWKSANLTSRISRIFWFKGTSSFQTVFVHCFERTTGSLFSIDSDFSSPYSFVIDRFCRGISKWY